jgi:hypothetical protein
MPCQLSVTGDEFQITLVAELAGVGGLVPEELEAGDASTLLVDRDDRLDVADITESVGQGAKLGRCLDVASEEDEASRLDAPDEIGIGLVNLVTGDT